MSQSRKSYSDEFKFQVVLETFTSDHTIESICRKHGIHMTQINQWRKAFKEHGHTIFSLKRTHLGKKSSPDKDPTELTRIIGELTIQNQILKKALSVWD
ncbi:transposase [Candidatus Gracilibacteria bacterium]|nr:transposase [Thermales bacterium]NJL96885.1 transposase [Candidatus Gracilibacteria bacterium]